MGLEAAEAILREYPTARALWRAYAEAGERARMTNPDPEAVLRGMLARLRISGISTVGPSRAAKVYANLFAAGMFA